MRSEITAVTLLITIAFVAVRVQAKKKETAMIIAGIKPYIACDVCDAMIDAAVAHSDALRKNASASGKKLTEDMLLDEVVEPLCNPHTTVGDYLRTLDWVVSSNNKVQFHVHSEYGKCKSKCWTAAEICDAIFSSDDADSLSALLLRQVAATKIKRTLCGRPCSAQKASGKAKAPLVAWGAEPFEPIDDKEKEIEEMMERMAQGPHGGQGADVFTRDEMMDIQAAMSAGDLERLQELDPTYSELDEDSFAALRKMSSSESSDGLTDTAEEDTVEPESPGLLSTFKSWVGW